MAPTAVLAEHTAKKIVLTRAYGVQSLRDAGVRIVGLETLAAAIADLQAKQATRRGSTSVGVAAVTVAAAGEPVLLPDGLWRPLPYQFADGGKPTSSAKVPPWRAGSTRFNSGETLVSIAMNPPSGRASVQVSTAANYVLTGLLHGVPTDLRRLARELAQSDCGRGQLTTTDVESFELAAEKLGVDFSGDFVKTTLSRDIIRGIPGAELATGLDLEYGLRSHDQSQAYSAICLKINIWKHYRAAGLWAIQEHDSTVTKRARLV
jgi:hypothetical protein